MDALIVVFASGLISLFAAFAKKPGIVVSTALLGLLAGIGLMINNLATGKALFELVKYEGLQFDVVALVFSIAICLLAFLIVGIGYERFKENPNHTGDYIALLIFSTTGAMILTAFTDMFMFFLGLEILSIPIYVMAGSNKTDVRSTEAALKYFLMGSFATGVFLFGLAWIYGATGTFKITEIAMKLTESEGMNSMALVGILFILVSFIFKIGAAPFHFWGPDVYQGAPHAVTGFMASVVKVAAFISLFKIFGGAFGVGVYHDFYMDIFMVVIIASMFIGNLSALRQVSLKRMMAYSSITHVGYTLIILFGASHFVENLLVYMLGYGLSIIGVVSVGMLVNDADDRIDALRGLAKRNPYIAVVGIVSILSLAGIPFTVGFFGKYMVFVDAWKNMNYWLVIIALINSAISIYYYLRVIMAMVAKSDEEQIKIKVSYLTYALLTVVLFGILSVGFFAAYLF